MAPDYFSSVFITAVDQPPSILLPGGEFFVSGQKTPKTGHLFFPMGVADMW